MRGIEARARLENAYDRTVPKMVEAYFEWEGYIAAGKKVPLKVENRLRVLEERVDRLDDISERLFGEIIYS